MRKKGFIKICTILLSLAPIVAFKVHSMFLIGEPSIPECVKKLN